jgi:transcriptional regulator with XRE-family HTH domain
MNEFGEKLRKLRKYHKVTLQWLAQQLGYTTHSYISEIESGRKTPTVQFVLKISRLFNVTTDELLKDEMDINLENSKNMSEIL